MTISTTENRAKYSGDGITTTFAFKYKVNADGDLGVILTDADGNETTQVLGTDYDVTGVGDDTGGSVIFGTAPSSAYTVIIYRDPPVTQ